MVAWWGLQGNYEPREESHYRQCPRHEENIQSYLDDCYCFEIGAGIEANLAEDVIDHVCD